MKTHAFLPLTVCCAALLWGSALAADGDASVRHDEPQDVAPVESAGTEPVDAADGSKTNWWLVSLGAAAVVGLVTVMGDAPEETPAEQPR